MRHYVKVDVYNTGHLMNVFSAAAIKSKTDMSPLAPLGIEQVMRIRGDIRLGVPVILTSGSQAVLIVAIEMLTAERFAVLAAASQKIGIALTRHRARALGIELQSTADVVRFELSERIDLAVLQRLADPVHDAAHHPVSKMLSAATDGSIIHEAAIALTKSAQLLPAVICLSVPDGAAEAARLGIGMVPAAEVMAELGVARVQHPVSAAPLPMAVHDAGHVAVFRPDDGGLEHYAIRIGTPDVASPVLVRLHSACFTGDVLGSLKCDCGPQLHAAMESMASQGAGVLLYLNQEGRGIGLPNKMRAYALQKRGIDTVEANHHIGFADDERDFRVGAALLRQMGIGAVRLLTNNPAKVAMLESCGIKVVERVAIEVGKSAYNAGYLATKAAKSGHIFK